MSKRFLSICTRPLGSSILSQLGNRMDVLIPSTSAWPYRRGVVAFHTSDWEGSMSAYRALMRVGGSDLESVHVKVQPTLRDEESVKREILSAIVSEGYMTPSDVSFGDLDSAEDACILSIRSVDASSDLLSRSCAVLIAKPPHIRNYYVDDPTDWVMQKSFI